jgi:hypothetical protein
MKMKVLYFARQGANAVSELAEQMYATALPKQKI